MGGQHVSKQVMSMPSASCSCQAQRTHFACSELPAWLLKHQAHHLREISNLNLMWSIVAGQSAQSHAWIHPGYLQILAWPGCQPACRDFDSRPAMDPQPAGVCPGRGARGSHSVGATRAQRRGAGPELRTHGGARAVPQLRLTRGHKSAGLALRRLVALFTTATSSRKPAARTGTKSSGAAAVPRL